MCGSQNNPIKSSLRALRADACQEDVHHEGAGSIAHSLTDSRINLKIIKEFKRLINKNRIIK